MRALFDRAAGGLSQGAAWASRIFAKKDALEPPPDDRSIDGVRRVLEAIAKDNGPIVVGPWMSEVGFELLYWIPFLRWATDEYGLDRTRIVVISRGGVKSWYRGICGRYVDIFDAIEPAELRSLNEQRSRVTSLQKHTVRTEVDDQILARLGFSETSLVLHPEVMYNFFERYWSGLVGFSQFSNHTIFRRLKAPLHSLLDKLPSSYTAVKFYSRPSFPRAENTSFVERLILQLAEQGPVVLLNTGLCVDEHEEFPTPRHPNIIPLEPLLRSEENLLAQSAVIGRASRTYCTYGGFSYLPLIFGVPAIGFFSRDKHFLKIHGRAAYFLSHKMKAPLSIMDTGSLEMLLEKTAGLRDSARGGEEASSNRISA